MSDIVLVSVSHLLPQSVQIDQYFTSRSLAGSTTASLLSASSTRSPYTVCVCLPSSTIATMQYAPNTPLHQINLCCI